MGRGSGYPLGVCLMYCRAMRLFTAQVMWANYRVISIPVDAIMDVWPESDYPHGRKAFHMCELWNGVRTYNYPGVLWMDPDVAADPDDLGAMQLAVQAAPEAMHTGLVKLWPESTGRPDWIWSHRGGTLGQPAATQEDLHQVAYVSTGFLWTPAVLLDLTLPGLAGAQWAEVDVALSERALLAGIPAWTVAGCQPKHLHFTKEHDGAHILRRSTSHR